MKKATRIAAALAAAVPSLALAATDVLVPRHPGCICGEHWAALVRQQLRRKIQMVDDNRRSVYQTRLGVPARLPSCHTALVDGLVFEGHVPIADMRRLLREHPRGVVGLAVAAMPMGSPGMEMPGMRGEAYDVVAFGPAGTHIYAHHGG